MRAGFSFQDEVEQQINCRSELPTTISDLPLQFGNKLLGIAPVLRSPIQEAPVLFHRNAQTVGKY